MTLNSSIQYSKKGGSVVWDLCGIFVKLQIASHSRAPDLGPASFMFKSGTPQRLGSMEITSLRYKLHPQSRENLLLSHTPSYHHMASQQLSLFKQDTVVPTLLEG